uniref:Uncharacterized protein n=1 Tax=Strongyloides papillosus TaxID=174720 RepID=A0A0N5B5E1_STREA
MSTTQTENIFLHTNESSPGFFSSTTNAIIGYTILGSLIILLIILFILFLFYYTRNAKNKKNKKEIALPNGVVIIDDSDEIYRKRKEEREQRIMEELRKKKEEKRWKKKKDSMYLYGRGSHTVKASNVASVSYYNNSDMVRYNKWNSNENKSQYA